MNPASTVEELFGRLEETFPGFEFRPQQLEFAKQVFRSIDKGIPGIFEAGTGTGKSLAALIPAALSGKKVVVSTATISLQEQYIHKDIPSLEKVLPHPIKAALVKGRSNYVSLRRFEDYKLEYEVDPRIIEWLADSEDGDRSELDFMPPPDQWMEIDSDADDCMRNKCPNFGDCFYFKARKEAETADILVVNHALLLVDAASGGNVLPPYDVLIVDEAHHLPGIATNSLSLSISLRSVRFMTSRIAKQLSPPGHLLHSVDEIAEEFFARIDKAVPGRSARIKVAPSGIGEFAEALRELHAWLASAKFENILDVDDKREKLKLKARSLATTCGGFVKCLDLLEAQTNEWVFWVERPEPGYMKLELVAAPLSVSDMLSDLLFNKPGLQTTVWMSATLATGGADPFAFFKEQVGAPSRVIQDRFASPFDFGKQAALYLPARMPEPNTREFTYAALSEIERLIQLSRGRAFVLFTSYSAMNTAYDALSGHLPYESKKQGQMSRKKLIDWFRATPGAVLFATASFWEGVSVDGEQLSCVIIDRIPFQSPDDPVYEARCERLKAESGDWFSQLALPHAVMRLKQGVGRLIRTRSDTGVVAILDPRLTTKAYGRNILACLPPMKVVRSIEKFDCIDDVLLQSTR